MRFIFLCILVGLTFFTSSCSKSAEEYTLTILHTNDIHSYIMGKTAEGRACDSDEKSCFGGYPRLEAAIEAAKSEYPDALILDAGDNFMGTLFFTLYKSPIIAEFMNRLGYTATTFGNHEFDNGCEETANFAKLLKFPIVSTNIDNIENSPLAGLTKPYFVLTHNGRKIGFIGLTTETTPETSSPCKELQFVSALEAAKKAVPKLKAEGIDIIIALTHLGYDEDKDLASKVEGIDIIIGAHSHTLLGDPDQPDTAAAAGPYPTEVKSPSGEPVIIVTAKCYAEYLGILNVSFNKHGVAKSWSGAPKRLHPDASSSAEAKEKALEYAKGFQAYKEEVLGKVVGEADVNIRKCRSEECATGNLITEAMLEWGKKHDAVIAFIGGGTIRTPLCFDSSGKAKSDVNMEDIMTSLPFVNNLVVREVFGSDLLLALEHSVARITDDPDKDLDGGFFQMSGMSIVYDSDKPAGARVTSTSVKDVDGNSAPISPDKTYKVVLIDFNANGGDGYVSLGKQPMKANEAGVLLTEVVGEYIKKYSPVTGFTDGRIKRISTKK